MISSRQDDQRESGLSGTHYPLILLNQGRFSLRQLPDQPKIDYEVRILYFYFPSIMASLFFPSTSPQPFYLKNLRSLTIKFETVKYSRMMFGIKKYFAMNMVGFNSMVLQPQGNIPYHGIQTAQIIMNICI
jgi:hypothetical protein